MAAIALLANQRILVHLALAEAALMTVQSTPAWTAIEAIRRARALLVASALSAVPS